MSSITTACRDIQELLPVAQTACRLLFQECYKAGITDIFITETYRSQERQNYLYEQGRTRPGQIVTWTKSSRHTSRLAWDIAVAPPKSLYDVATLSKVGAIARKLCITWGGDWPANNIDRPHFEVSKSWTIPRGYKLEGEVIIPTNSNTKVNLIRKGELTVEQYNDLKKLIESQNKIIEVQIKKIDELEQKLGLKEREVSESHKEAWKWAKENGLLNGQHPQRPVTREQLASVLYRQANQ